MDKIEELKKNIEMLKQSSDPEFSELIRDEIKKLEGEIVKPEEGDAKNAILEIRAGTGGEEAELFAAELARMYLKFAEKNGWKIAINDKKDNNIGGLKEFLATISGQNVYGSMKYEAGVHRVQRVPKTEKQGRIHTSAATVVVLPEIEGKLVEIKSEDLKIDVYRAGGHGGQSVNTTDSAVRITHLPTNIVVTCQDERSQLKNKEKAMGILRAKIWQADQDEKLKENSEKRLSMVKTGDRSEKIRTYNYPQDRITDHRIPRSWNNMQKILDGNLDPVISELQDIDRKNKLEEYLSTN
ncbi:MAG: peptide chain release factor 1 [Candidatus Berkelbacteria bacterium]|nr:peptide chain release factor 1 [Candidatus Berkelbacteria bacterium]